MKVNRVGKTDIGDAVKLLKKKLQADEIILIVYFKDGKLRVSTNPELRPELAEICVKAVGQIFRSHTLEIAKRN